MPRTRLRFDGTIAGIGTRSGVRLVVGHWPCSPLWCAAIDRPARLLMPGVRTRGSAGGGRREWYGAQDVHPIVAATARLDGRDLGPLAPVHPPVRFGFGSTPRRPALVRVTTTVEIPSPGDPGVHRGLRRGRRTGRSARMPA